MFEKNTNTFVCKAPGREMLQEARETRSSNKILNFKNFPVWIKISSLSFITPIFVICRPLTKENMKKYLS